MRKYEIMYILNPEASDLQANHQKLQAILTANNGKILETGDWGVKDLAYPIKKKKKGYYTVLIVETTSENVNELLRISHIESDVLRVMVINTEKEKNYIQSTVYAKTEIKNERTERPERRGGNRRFDRRPERADNQGGEQRRKENNENVQPSGPKE